MTSREEIHKEDAKRYDSIHTEDFRMSQNIVKRYAQEIVVTYSLYVKNY